MNRHQRRQYTRQTMPSSQRRAIRTQRRRMLRDAIRSASNVCKDYMRLHTYHREGSYQKRGKGNRARGECHAQSG